MRLSSVLPLYKWSSPDETERQPAVHYRKRMTEITADLGCPLMNSEFNGRPDRVAENEAAFRRSLEELLPVFEREGIALDLEAHRATSIRRTPRPWTWPAPSTGLG